MSNQCRVWATEHRPTDNTSGRICQALVLCSMVSATSALLADDNTYSPYAERAYPTELLFGETHVHSAPSADAGSGGTSLMPRDVYRFARGGQVTSNTGQTARLARGFDFFALTEHTDGMGVITDILRGSPNIMADEQGKYFHERDTAPGFMVWALRDPDGVNLDRVQIIKGWVDSNGNTREQIYNVAWSGDRTPGPHGTLPAVDGIRQCSSECENDR